MWLQHSTRHCCLCTLKRLKDPEEYNRTHCEHLHAQEREGLSNRVFFILLGLHRNMAQIRVVIISAIHWISCIKTCCLLLTYGEPDWVNGSQFRQCADWAEGAEMHRLRDLKKHCNSISWILPIQYVFIVNDTESEVSEHWNIECCGLGLRRWMVTQCQVHIKL